MLQLTHLQRALGWGLAGLLGTYLLINVIGFLSPFWAAYVLGDAAHRSHDLLHFWQPIIPWFSVCFAIAAWHLARTFESTPARVAVVAMGLLVAAAHVGEMFADRAIRDSGLPTPPELPSLVYMLSGAVNGAAAIGAVWLVWWVVRRSNRIARIGNAP